MNCVALTKNPKAKQEKNTRVDTAMALTYSFTVIIVQCGVFIVWPRQCREVLVMYGEVLCLFGRRLCHHANFNILKQQKKQNPSKTVTAIILNVETMCTKTNPVSGHMNPNKWPEMKPQISSDGLP